MDGLFQSYVGNTLNAAERARFDFPEKSITGQPLGVRKSGYNETEHRTLTTKADPSYMPSPSADLIKSQQLFMPEIKNSSPQHASNNANNTSNGSSSGNNGYGSPPIRGSPGHDQDAYIERLRRQSEEKQHQIMLAENAKMQYKQQNNHNHDISSLDQFKPAQTNSNIPLMMTNSNTSNSNDNGNGNGTSNISPEKFNNNAIKKLKQQKYFNEITEMSEASPIPTGHSILLNQPKGYKNVNNPQKGIINGQGELYHIENMSSEQKRLQQAQFRNNVEAAAASGININNSNSNDSVGHSHSGNHLPSRERPPSPNAPIPGQNGLMTLGSHDTLEYKHQKMIEAKAMLQRQIAETQQYKLMTSTGTPMLRSSDEYGSGSNSNSDGSWSNRSGSYALIQNKKNITIPERDPNQYFPTQNVQEAKTRAYEAAQAAQAAATANYENGNSSSKTLSQENYERKKNAAVNYQNALDSDRHDREQRDKDRDNNNERIRLDTIDEKSANKRHEKNLLFSPIKKGPNIMDTMGKYEMDHRDNNKKREMQATYRSQLQAAQAASTPISLQYSERMTPNSYSIHQQQLKQQQYVQPDPFKASSQYQERIEQFSRGNVTLPIDHNTNAQYQGFSRAGFDASDPVHQQMRQAEIEKQQEFLNNVKKSQEQEPILSPRSMLYKRKYLVSEGKDYDVTTPYGMLTNSLNKNEDIINEKMKIDGMKKIAQQLRVEQLQSDEIMNENARNTPNIRHSNVKKHNHNHNHNNDDNIDGNIDGSSNDLVPHGLPVLSNTDWNLNSLDYKWNVNQNPDDVLSPRSYAKAHKTYQMHYPDVSSDSSYIGYNHATGKFDQLLSTVTSDTNTTNININPYQYDNGSAINTSLPLKSLDIEKAIHAKNKMNYNQGVLSDRSEKKRLLQQKEYEKMLHMQKQMSLSQQYQQSGGVGGNQSQSQGQLGSNGGYQHVPPLEFVQQTNIMNYQQTTPLPNPNPNLHNPHYGGQGLDPVSGVTALASGRQPQVPNGYNGNGSNKPSYSQFSMNDPRSQRQPHHVGNESTLDRNRRNENTSVSASASASGTGTGTTPHQAGFRRLIG
jgi:hypothetical protein